MEKILTIVGGGIQHNNLIVMDNNTIDFLLVKIVYVVKNFSRHVKKLLLSIQNILTLLVYVKEMQ